jgi:hypothetical protein
LVEVTHQRKRILVVEVHDKIVNPVGHIKVSQTTDIKASDVRNQSRNWDLPARGDETIEQGDREDAEGGQGGACNPQERILLRRVQVREADKS